MPGAIAAGEATDVSDGEAVTRADASRISTYENNVGQYVDQTADPDGGYR